MKVGDRADLASAGTPLALRSAFWVSLSGSSPGKSTALVFWLGEFGRNIE